MTGATGEECCNFWTLVLSKLDYRGKSMKEVGKVMKEVGNVTKGR